MTEPDVIAEPQPNVNPAQPKGPTRRGQQYWIGGTGLLIAGLAAAFIVVILIVALTR